MKPLAIFLVAIGSLGSVAAAATPVAFPGAYGFGAGATGGRGGTIVHVTNLNNSGAGSLRDAVSAGDRIVVFDVGGYINLTSTLVIGGNNITIAGQTAPGDGIGIMGQEVTLGGHNNIIMRYLRFRPGSGSPSGDNGINLYQASNVIIDHASIEYAKWNNIDAVNATNITIQNSIIADPIGQQFAAHTEGGGNFTWYNNVFANAHNRQPLAKANTQFINNIVYNYQAGYTVANTAGVYSHDIINNIFVAGPATTSSGNAFYQMNGNQSVYASGNLRDTNENGSLDGSVVGPSGVVSLTSPAFATTTSIPTLGVTAAYAKLIAAGGAGASIHRDDIDALILSEVNSKGTRGPYPLPTSQSRTGLDNDGFGTLDGGPQLPDFDGDGIPNAWELSHGLDPNLQSDAYLIDPGSGYMNIELYINSIPEPAMGLFLASAMLIAQRRQRTALTSTTR
ncbi:MAG TPA: hypothetical protein VHD56_00415 [Tepidisphaeraceae bacterium]|nr:hypothetical protein [Tepidisphaeraceae bacterium]